MENKALQYALYGTTRFSLSDRLHVLAGARVNWWDGETGDGETTAASYKFSGEMTPYLGFTYDLNETYTAYGSIATIYKPQLVQDVDRNYLDPTYGYNYKLGVKGDLLDGGLQVAAAVFQTDQRTWRNTCTTSPRNSAAFTPASTAPRPLDSRCRPRAPPVTAGTSRPATPSARRGQGRRRAVSGST